MSATVIFCVGGQQYSTIRETILKEPASRLGLLIRGVLPAVKDEAGTYFVDRDPRFFQLILNFLRDGWAMLPRSPDDRRLAGFEAWIRTQELLGDRSDAIPVYPGSPMSVEPMKSSNLESYKSGLHAFKSTIQAEVSRIEAEAAAAAAAAASLSKSLSGRLNSPMASPRSGLQSQASMLGLSSPRSSPTMLERQKSQAGLSSPRAIPEPLEDDGVKWTSKYLQTNERLREVVSTMLELAYLPPHRSLHLGKVHLCISVDCDHTRVSALLGSATEYLRSKVQMVKIQSSADWSYSFTVRPSCDITLFEKYAITDFVQDNWFVLCAVLKDQYGILLEEDASLRPSCAACRRTNLAVTMLKM